MDPVEELVRTFQELVSQVPEPVQPFVVMLAAAVPFIEGEVAALIGVVGGLHPVVAGLAAAAGNFLCVLVVVLLTSRARTAVIRSRSRANPAVAGKGTAVAVEEISARQESKGRQRFKKWLVRFGVPGASILGPLAIPTQITSALLVSGGTPRGWVLLWQAVAIVLWTALATVSAWAALTFVVGV
ncbi:small multidrug efflux protein [Isoptericola halotolerans]|uniref:small multidrug efflux protein n=1 Tax=Isoptericola halotolerans TaxID=300560 RepID=UPI0038911128